MADFPFEIHDIDEETEQDLKEKFAGHSQQQGFVQVSPHGYIVQKKYRKLASDIYNFEVHPDDVWVCTYPRCGTTLTQEIVWMVANNFDYETASKKSLLNRFPFIDMNFMINDEVEQRMLAAPAPALDGFRNCMLPKVAAATSPRFVKTHLPFSLLPPTLLDTCKVVYVARNPKDVALSCYHHNRLFNGIGYVGDFPTYWDYFERDLISPSPYWRHTQEGWDLRGHPNLLFLFYEDIILDWPACIRTVASFLGKPVTGQQVARLAEHMHIDTFRNNPSVNMDMDTIPAMRKEGEQGFVRKGETGSWKAEFTPELAARADRWIAENIKTIRGFTFPASKPCCT